MNPSTVTSRSERETCEIAAAFGRTLSPGAIVLLSGDLGAGKTAFVRGLAEGVGIDPGEVTSPTFMLVHQYDGGRMPLVHVDLYRLETADLDDIGLDPEVAERGVLAVEWAERLARPIPEAVRVTITDAGGDARTIEIVLSYQLPVQS